MDSYMALRKLSGVFVRFFVNRFISAGMLDIRGGKE
jgi:hypothetical protein